ncbi:hypothetical protein [Thiomicrorhabdus sp.]|uniref:hypothetical protein n=1 Tax=Thiomicrorhabdus sp. TaxID=2039724 RepID=UPI0029C8CE8F|nr:hypothetical protein [Thiomicrorhabdus sp.]
MKKRIVHSSILLLMIGGLSACGGGSDSGTDSNAGDGAGSSSDQETRAFSSAVDTPELDYSGGAVYWDLETNSIVSESDDWELKITQNGYEPLIQINGGASGPGDAGLGAYLTASADEVTDPTDTAQVYKYFEDSASGVLSTPGGYGPLEYNVAGGHKMWPNFATYVFNDNGVYYKAQVISNYGEQGTDSSGTLRIRYALAGDSATTEDQASVVTLDAASDTSSAAFLDMAAGQAVGESDSWQFAYQKYIGFKTNSGVSGSGSIEGCLAHTYSALYDDTGAAVQSEFEGKTAANTLDDFNAVTTANCSEWLTDDVQSQIVDWYSYDMTTHTVTVNTDATNGWILRSSSMSEDNGADYRYARIKIKTFGSSKLVFSVESWEAQ